jgi:1-aminocyclopropane-1-carboxylate deaminase/D-cysteine desulfhydrase-like pyridoxal-dependent ACC family enzyme
MKLSKLPRIRLASLPTPLQEFFGGNKARKLEYLMGDAVAKGADYIITGAGFHSNWCTQTAAAARRLEEGSKGRIRP